MKNKINRWKVYVVLMDEMNGCPLGGGPSRKAERASRAEAEADLAGLKSNHCDGYVEIEIREQDTAPQLMTPCPEVMPLQEWQAVYDTGKPSRKQYATERK